MKQGHCRRSARALIGEPLDSPLRYPAAAAALVAAAAHVPLIPEHLADARYIGVLFFLLALAGSVEAALLVRRDSRRIWLAMALTCVGALAAFTWSRSLGLPQLHDEVGNWTEPLALVAVTFESLAAVLAGAVLMRRSRSARRAGWVHVAAGAVLFAAGAGWTGVAAAGNTDAMAESAESEMAGSAYWQQVGGEPFHGDGVTRTYYIGADPVVWDYAPDKRNDITGRPFDEAADVFVRSGPGRIGSRYVKCLYRGYTDPTFSRLTVRPAGEASLGLLGPTIRAEVGDTLKIVFRNSCPFPTSVHAHGVSYGKASEGAPYSDGTAGAAKADDAVPPGGTHTSVWQVPERAGPGPRDGSSVMWMYHSHTDEVADTNAGLMGALVVTRRGMARPDGSPRDVDREVFASFSVMNENNSQLLLRNERRFERPYQPVSPGDEEGFEESNLMHSINGYVFGNQPMISLRRGERVRWYVMGLGTEVDLHTPHWHGNDVTGAGMRMDVVNLLPASMLVADMVPDNPGVWLFHCHVNDHISAGMLTRFRVT